jgi:prolyl 4-hydroxylase
MKILLNLYRYEPGQFFAPHFDGIFKRSYIEQSQLTIMVYLNDSFTGGNTNFLDDTSKPHGITCALKPEIGMVLIFEHDMFHEGETLVTGKKYIMRRLVSQF